MSNDPKPTFNSWRKHHEERVRRGRERNESKLRERQALREQGLDQALQREDLNELQWLLKQAERRARKAFDDASRTMTPNAFAAYQRSVAYVRALEDLKTLLQGGEKPTWTVDYYRGGRPPSW